MREDEGKKRKLLVLEVERILSAAICLTGLILPSMAATDLDLKPVHYSGQKGYTFQISGK